jgi:hypothetical protein
LNRAGYAAVIPVGMRSTRFALVLAVLGLVTLAVLALGTKLHGKVTYRPSPQRADGSLSIAPTPLTLDSLRRVAPGSASQAVLRLWFWAQWAGGASVLAAYDPRLVQGVGAGEILLTYRYARLSLGQVEPKVIGESVGPAGTVVRIKLLAFDRPPTYYSYTLRRVNGSWYITYDTVLRDELAAAVQDRATRPGHPASQAAVQAGLDAARHYQNVSVRLRGALPPSTVVGAPS